MQFFFAFLYLLAVSVFFPNASPSSIVVVSSQPLVSGRTTVMPAAISGNTANASGGIHNALALLSITKGAIIEPMRAAIDEKPRAAFRTTVGNSSVQYKYTTTKTIKLATTPMLAQTTEPTPSGITAKINKQIAQIR